jgi:hypothetical protein
MTTTLKVKTFAHKIKPFDITDLGLTKDDMVTLNEISSRLLDKSWNTTAANAKLTPEEKTLIAKFKINLKDYLWKIGQGCFCCFCGIELSKHNASKDAEHLISKKGKANLVFELKNIALSCKDCNGFKKNHTVTNTSTKIDADIYLKNSDDYQIFHPHLDEWPNHFKRDEYNRVLVENDSSKAEFTIKLCRIHRKNALRLLNHFDQIITKPEHHDDWIDLYEILIREKINSVKSKKIAEFITGLASKNPAAEELEKILLPLLN